MSPRRHLVATAGHVDHGKSTLVRALTGMEPDRWAEEQRRGLTIDLGFAWTTLPSGQEVAFVDVPGHQRFLGNMLAGLGPAPVVMFVVAADEGWRAQSSDHRDAVAALGIHRGLLVLTRADLASAAQLAQTEAQARAELAGTGLGAAPAVAVSAVTGAGLDQLRRTLDQVLGRQPEPDRAARVRLWIDRAFSITGAGTVVTGTLAAGTLTRDARLDLAGPHGRREVSIRSLQRQGRTADAAMPVSRVAVNLRGIATTDVARGDALVSPGAWWFTDVIDVRRASGSALDDVPEQLIAHVGTASVQARLRPFDADHSRLHLDRQLPLAVGDRLVLRRPGGRLIGGAQVLDADPPPLTRRGDAGRRTPVLARLPPTGDPAVEVARRGAAPEATLRVLGLSTGTVPDSVLVSHGWWIDVAACRRWAEQLRKSVTDLHTRDPLAAGLSARAVRDLLQLPDERLVTLVAEHAGLVVTGGQVSSPDRPAGLGSAEPAVAELERLLTEQPYAAPEADELTRLGLGPRELAAAERAGRLLRLGSGVVLLPRTPATTMRLLAGLPQPFTTSEARQALGTTRRVVIPLLEHLDSRGWTRRVDAGHREVVRPS